MHKFYNVIFFLTLMLGTMMAISATSWFTSWIGLEMNLLSLMPIMKSTKNKYATESMMKYFMTQALASIIILMMSILILNNKSLISNLDTLNSSILSSALFMKMGAAPLHFWLPEVISGLSWPISFLILTWQKIAPMIMLLYTHPTAILTSTTIILSSIIGGVGGLNQICLRKILAYSSINHIAWMLSALMISSTTWMIYFSVYFIINLSLIIQLNSNNIFFISQLDKNLSKNKMEKLLFTMNFFSLGGLPPFLGFLPKWLTIYHLISHSMYIMTTILILTTLLSLFMYTRITFSSTILVTKESNMKKNNFFLFPFYMFSSMSIMGLMIILSTSIV
uniref:NADH-ubiquinone oxidoreductase chain 2 n=1 Tax=Scolytinae sp. BMNH 1039896 TaxID=1903768 RepID=A0A343A4Y9_9CUCU|nr:NADH dehydrogenase subunit 2 [Scolytinae sp. BMNH 1039896]